MLQNYQREIISLMHKQELLLSELYRIFSNQFPACAKFWRELADEEEQHAQWIHQLFHLIESNHIIFEEGAVKTYTLKTFIEGLEQDVQRALSKTFTQQEALALTNNYETSLIEKKSFEKFIPVHDKAKRVMRILSEETKDHMKRAREMMNQSL